MNILFTTDNQSAASAVYYSELLAGMSDIDDVSLEYHHREYRDQDVILFMGYDPDVATARKHNKDAKIGIIDPRPPFDSMDGVDFIIANGLEMRDYCRRWTDNIYVYYVYPDTTPVAFEKGETGPIVFGYHGNSVHLKAMYPRVTNALERLGREREIELWVVYNIRTNGKWTQNLPSSKYVKVKHIQWSPRVYAENFPGVHIGLVPGLIPMRNSTSPWISPIFGRNRFNADSSDYVLRFKVSSNPGRLIVFARHRIPVIADFFPSALQFIEDGENGYLCNSEAAWYSSMRMLADSADRRNRFANSLYEKVDRLASPRVMNNGLIDFLRGLAGRTT